MGIVRSVYFWRVCWESLDLSKQLWSGKEASSQSTRANKSQIGEDKLMVHGKRNPDMEDERGATSRRVLYDDKGLSEWESQHTVPQTVKHR